MLINADEKNTDNEFLIEHESEIVHISYTRKTENPHKFKYMFTLIDKSFQTRVLVSTTKIDDKPVYYVDFSAANQSKSFVELIDVLNSNDLIINTNWEYHIILDRFKVNTFHIDYDELITYVTNVNLKQSINTLILDIHNYDFESFVNYIYPVYKKTNSNECFLESLVFEANKDYTHIISKLRTKSLILRIFVNSDNFINRLSQLINRFFTSEININVSIHFCIIDNHIRDVFDYNKVFSLLDIITKVDNIKVYNSNCSLIYDYKFDELCRAKLAYNQCIDFLKRTKIQLEKYKPIYLK